MARRGFAREDKVFTIALMSAELLVKERIGSLLMPMMVDTS
jgi:hypothetical protein